MNLLIAVSKLLTGFDAPSCTYICLDNKLHDHKSFSGYLPNEPAGRRRQDYGQSLVSRSYLVVPHPRELEQFLHCFCGDTATPNALNETEVLRVSFYKAVATFVRAFAAMAQDLTEAGHSDSEAEAMRKEVEFFSEVRAAIKSTQARSWTSSLRGRHAPPHQHLHPSRPRNRPRKVGRAFADRAYR
jgi:type I restriction enzyme R subunit